MATPPARTVSPVWRRVSAVIAAPLTVVPFELPRSVTESTPPREASRRWRRETFASVTSTPSHLASHFDVVVDLDPARRGAGLPDLDHVAQHVLPHEPGSREPDARVRLREARRARFARPRSRRLACGAAGQVAAQRRRVVYGMPAEVVVEVPRTRRGRRRGGCGSARRRPTAPGVCRPPVRPSRRGPWKRRYIQPAVTTCGWCSTRSWMQSAASWRASTSYTSSRSQLGSRTSTAHRCAAGATARNSSSRSGRARHRGGSCTRMGPSRVRGAQPARRRSAPMWP